MAVVSYPAPVGGWNARDDLASMPPTDAVVLRNWRPRPGYLETRAGSSLRGTPAPTGHDGVGTVTTFRSTFGDFLIFGGGDDLYSYNGVVTGSNIAQIFTGAVRTGTQFWDSAHFQDKLIMTLGDGDVKNKAQVLTASDAFNVTSTDLNITAGPNEEDIRGVQVHKGRAYYWETASQSFWYAAAGAYQGDLTEFDLGTALKHGSALQMMVTISIDGGGGQDDLAAFIFGSGEVLVYQGDDPGSASSWELVGAFQIGQPVDPQAHEKIAGTELVYTRDGVVDLSAAIRLGRFGESAEFSNKITKAVTEAAFCHSGQGGWQVLHAPGDNCVILNIPQAAGVYKQYVRETDSGAWWECNGLEGRFGVFYDKLHMVGYSGGELKVMECFTQEVDAYANDDERTIETNVLPAFVTMKDPSRRKVLTSVKPFTTCGKTSAIRIVGRSNFDTTVPITPSETSGSTLARTQPNKSVNANGHYISYVMQTREVSQKQIQWNATSLFYELGGPV